MGNNKIILEEHKMTDTQGTKNIERDIIDSKMIDEIKTAKQALDLQEKIDNLYCQT